MHYNLRMKSSPSGKSKTIQIRLAGDEKAAFLEAASLAGLPLSTWVRERLRLAAIRELEGAGKRVPFVKPVPLGESRG